MNQFAASMSASRDSQQPVSPQHSIRKEFVSRLSINLHDQSEEQHARESDLPLIDIHKAARQLGPSREMKSPIRLKQRSGLDVLQETRQSRNTTLMQIVSKTEDKNAREQMRKKNSTQFVKTRSDFSDSVKAPMPNSSKKSADRTKLHLLEVSKPSEQSSSCSARVPSSTRSKRDKECISRQSFQRETSTREKPIYRSRFEAAGINEPLPLLAAGTYKEEPEAMWKKRRLKQNLAANKLSKAEQELQQEKEAFEQAQKKIMKERQKADKELHEVQRRLKQSARNIKVSSELSIAIEDYPEYFKYKIYEAFKPLDLAQTRNYIEFLTTNEPDSSHCTVYEEDLSPELYSYLSRDMETRLPTYINQKKLLQFDSNFESGNLDSVYLVNEAEYNLLCKVDTNTKGNTYWFYFKVLNWSPKATATFNLLNVARDLHPFYSKGMQIWTRTESVNGRYKSDWQCSTDNVHVVSFQQNEIVRSRGTKKEYAMGKYYNTLKFKCTFPEIQNLTKPTSDAADGYKEVGPNDQGAPGTVLCFAYALPYTYTDLLSDLEASKKFLLSKGGIIVNEVLALEHRENQKQKAIFKGSDGLESDQGMPNKRRKVVKKESDRQVLTKNQIATNEMKKMAIKTVKDKMGKFEIELLKADEEVESPLFKQARQTKGSKLLEIHTDSLYYKQEVVSKSVGGLNIYQLTITKRKGPNCLPYHRKKCMYITARLHAAETHGSVIMKSIMSELVTKSENYDSILSNYIIKLVPMINTDGVSIGNSRSSLVGLDLNRRWAEPNSSIHPEIFFLKKIMQQQADTAQGISIYCDLHGHNRKNNCFFYGCNKAADEGMLSWTKTRLLPKIFASIEQIFDFKGCRFKQDKYKLNTARVVVWNEMKVTNSFTLETSMYAKTLGRAALEDPAQLTNSMQSTELVRTKTQHVQLQLKDLHQIAKSFLVSTAQYIKLEKELEKEWKLSVGWFKPSKLNAITGEAARDKQLRELSNKQKALKDAKKEQISGSGGPRKRVERMNSQSFQESSFGRRKIAKMSSNTRVNDSKTPKTDAIGQQATSTSHSRPTKRQQSLMNVSMLGIGAESKTQAGERSAKKDPKNSTFNLQTAQDTKEGEVSEKAKTARKPKGPKITGVNREDNTMSAQNAKDSAIFAKLTTWKEFFDPEEFQSGVAYMQKSLKALTELEEAEEDGGSDSEPSLDNFEATQLEGNLAAAIDKEAEAQSNPFVRPFKEREPAPVREKPKLPSSSSVSARSEPVQENSKFKPVLKELVTDQSEEEEVLSQRVDLSVNDPEKDSEPKLGPTSDESNVRVAPPIEPRQRQPVGVRSVRNSSHTRGSQISSQIDYERNRMMNYPELANQLINQLILQNNARLMKASAAPPSGSSQPVETLPNDVQELQLQNHMVRGQRYNNHGKASAQAQHSSFTDQAPQSEQTIYFTEQNRRMNYRNPSTQFTLVGQKVSSLNIIGQGQTNSDAPSNLGQNKHNRRQIRKQPPLIKGQQPTVNPAPTHKYLRANSDGQEMAFQNLPKSRGKVRDLRQQRLLAASNEPRTGGSNPISESRQAPRNLSSHVGQSRYTQHSSGLTSQGTPSVQQSYRDYSRKKAPENGVKVDQSHEATISSYRVPAAAPLEDSLLPSTKKQRGGARADQVQYSTTRNSRERSISKHGRDAHKSRMDHQQRILQEAQLFEQNQLYIMSENKTLKLQSPSIGANEITSQHYNTRRRGKMLNSSRQSFIKGTSEEGKSAIEQAFQIAKTPFAVVGNPQQQMRTPVQDHCIHQFAYSPIQGVQTSKKSQLGGDTYFTAPGHGAKKNSFSSPRYQHRNMGPANLKQGAEALASQPTATNPPASGDEQVTFFGQQPLTSPDGLSQSRGTSQASRIGSQGGNPSGLKVYNRQNMPNSPNGLDVAKQLAPKLSNSDPRGTVKTEGQGRKHDDSYVVIQSAKQRQGKVTNINFSMGGDESNKKFDSAASQRVTPIVGGHLKQIKIRKGRNFKSVRPSPQPSDPSGMTQRRQGESTGAAESYIQSSSKPQRATDR